MSQIVGLGCAGQDIEGSLKSASAKEVVQAEQTLTPKLIDPVISALPASSLCDLLNEIELIHDRVPEETDDLYKAIISKGSEALPCLVEKINDRTKTRDPRSAPKWQHYVVGDTAIFAILDIVSQGDDERWNKLFLEPLPPASKEEWKTNGVYAYFNYVSEPENRKALQSWWKNWLKESKK